MAAFLFTLVGLRLDGLLEKAFGRGTDTYGEYDLGVPVRRWGHWTQGSRTLMFAAIVAVLVEIVLRGEDAVTALLTIGTAIISYIAVATWMDKHVEEGHEHAMDVVRGCTRLVPLRKGLFDAYNSVRRQDLEAKNSTVRGNRLAVAEHLKGELNREGYKLLGKVHWIFFAAAMGLWVVLGLMLFGKVLLE